MIRTGQEDESWQNHEQQNHEHREWFTGKTVAAILDRGIQARLSVDVWVVGQVIFFDEE